MKKRGIVVVTVLAAALAAGIPLLIYREMQKPFTKSTSIVFGDAASTSAPLRIQQADREMLNRLTRIEAVTSAMEKEAPVIFDPEELPPLLDWRERFEVGIAECFAGNDCFTIDYRQNGYRVIMERLGDGTVRKTVSGDALDRDGKRVILINHDNDRHEKLTEK